MAASEFDPALRQWHNTGRARPRQQVLEFWGEPDPAKLALREGWTVKDHEILSAFTKILNVHGPDSPEEEAFLEQHGDNDEFLELAGLASSLKRALMKRPLKVEDPIKEPTSNHSG